MKTLTFVASALILICAGSATRAGTGAVVAGARQSGKLRQDVISSSAVGIAQTTAAPLLLTLLKDLRTEAEASLVLEGSTADWCRDARGQKSGMASALQRQLDEANNEMRQVALDGKRLSSEASLINSTTEQKEQQLKDATLTRIAASAEFQNERGQMQALLDATEHAIQLVEIQSDGGDAQQAGGAGHDMDSQLISSLAQLQRVAEGGQSGTLQGSGSLSMMRSRELRQQLMRLRERLRGALSSSSEQEQEMGQKHWIFADHLNSSLMEIQSQIAAIKMQVAQRKREHIRLERRAGDLQALLAAVAESRAATEAACAAEEKARSEVSQHIKAESLVVKTMLKQKPASEQPPQAATGTPSFLQVQEHALASSRAVQRAVDDLESMARRFPQEAALYDEGARRLSLIHGGPQGGGGSATSGATGAPSAGGGGAAGDAASEDDARSALRNIKMFVAANNDEGSQASGAGQNLRHGGAKRRRAASSTDEVGGLYTGLLERVRSKQQAVADQRSRCSALLRDAAVDRAALARSLKRIDAKSRIAKAMMSEYEQCEAYDKAQGKQISALLGRLSQLSKDAGSLRVKARNTLRDHAEELMALATDLSQQPSGDEQHTAQMVRSLAQKVDGHRRGLELQHVHLAERKEALDTADSRLLKLLQADAERNHRRMVGLQAERQLLSGLAFAKANDRELGAKYLDISNRLCSADGMSALEKKDRELQREEQVLQASAAGEPTIQQPPREAGPAE